MDGVGWSGGALRSTGIRLPSLPSWCCGAALFEFDGRRRGLQAPGFELVGEFRWVGGVDQHFVAVDVDDPEHDVFGGVTRIGDDVAEVPVDVAVFSCIARTQPEVAGLVLVEDVGLRSGLPGSPRL